MNITSEGQARGQKSVSAIVIVSLTYMKFGSRFRSAFIRNVNKKDVNILNNPFYTSRRALESL